jgi:hypothetical protein
LCKPSGNDFDCYRDSLLEIFDSCDYVPECSSECRRRILTTASATFTNPSIIIIFPSHSYIHVVLLFAVELALHTHFVQSLLQPYNYEFFLYCFKTRFGHIGPSSGVLQPKLPHCNLYIKMLFVYKNFFPHMHKCIICLMFSSFVFFIYIVHFRFNSTFKYLK